MGALYNTALLNLNHGKGAFAFISKLALLILNVFPFLSIVLMPYAFLSLATVFPITPLVSFFCTSFLTVAFLFVAVPFVFTFVSIIMKFLTCLPTGMIKQYFEHRPNGKQNFVSNFQVKNWGRPSGGSDFLGGQI